MSHWIVPCLVKGYAFHGCAAWHRIYRFEQVQAMLKYEPESGEVQLVVDRGYREGEPIKVWFGPQPNQRAFLNYGIVDEDNPHDKMTIEVSTLLSCHNSSAKE